MNRSITKPNLDATLNSKKKKKNLLIFPGNENQSKLSKNCRLQTIFSNISEFCKSLMLPKP